MADNCSGCKVIEYDGIGYWCRRSKRYLSEEDLKIGCEQAWASDREGNGGDNDDRDIPWS